MTPSGQFIDFARYEFWVACAVAIVALQLTTWAPLRKWMLAAVNLGFLGLLLGSGLASVAVAIVVVWLSLRAMSGEWFRTRGAWLIGGTTLLLFVLHKRWDFAVELGLYQVNVILATIGFSYVSLRLVEVLRSVFEGRDPVPDLPDFINYLLPFHMLAAGPVQSYEDFLEQPAVPDALTPRRVLEAVERISGGLFKKYVLAYAVDRLFLTGFTSEGWAYFLETQFFYVWLFLDFSAYSDIAVGIGRLMGVHTPENFNRPYLARNMIDFWERWHISLSLFIRRNLFIPVQLSLMRRTRGERPLMCATVAFTVSFVLCGLWHDIQLQFLLWGCLHALGLVLTNLYRHQLQARLGSNGVKRYLDNRFLRVAATIVTYEFVALSLVVAFS